MHAAADIIDTRRGEPDRVEVINHQRRCGEHVADVGGVAAERVDRGDLDLISRPLGAAVHPLAHDVAGSAWDDIEQAAPVDVDEGGRHLGPPTGIRMAEGVLIHAQTSGAFDPLIGDEEPVAVVDHRLVGASPADPERSTSLATVSRS